MLKQPPSIVDLIQWYFTAVSQQSKRFPLLIGKTPKNVHMFLDLLVWWLEKHIPQMVVCHGDESHGRSEQSP